MLSFGWYMVLAEQPRVLKWVWRACVLMLVTWCVLFHCKLLCLMVAIFGTGRTPQCPKRGWVLWRFGDGISTGWNGNSPLLPSSFTVLIVSVFVLGAESSLPNGQISWWTGNPLTSAPIKVHWLNCIQFSNVLLRIHDALTSYWFGRERKCSR